MRAYTYNVTGSGKRDNFAHTMIFSISIVVLRHLIFLTFWRSGIYNSLATLMPNFEELNALLTGQACCLKTAT